MKKLFFYLLTLLPVVANASEEVVDGINYEYYYRYGTDYSVALVVRNYPEYTGRVNIPTKVKIHLDSYDVIGIKERAFSGCSNLTDVKFPYTIKTIGEYNQEIMGKTNVEIIPVSA